MMMMVKVLPTIALFQIAFSVSAKAKDDSKNQCGVYLAESSTGHALGSFAGHNYEPDEAIGSQDAIIQFVDIREHNIARLEEDDGTRVENFLGTCWSGDATGGMAEGDEVISGVGGPCFSSTGHVGMINAVIYQPSTLLRTDSDLLSSGYDETTSPGRGAFTSYHNLTLLAVDKIPSGMEVFLDFGGEYNQYEDSVKPNIDDYRKMDEAIEKMAGFFNKHAESIGEEAAEEVFAFMKKDVLDLTAEKRAGAARSLLPDKYQGLQKIIDAGGSALSSNPEVRKDLDWLKMNGYCQDNLVVGVSKIEHAGRGAFAKRGMKKGEVVSPMPLVALNQGRTALTIVDEDEEGNEGTETKQLLYNYMLDHPESSALFFPAGAMSNYVNHGGKKANVKMIWSTKEWSHVESSHEISVGDLSLVGPVDMILELIATRPIKEGEEVLLDYGDDWAAAWKLHSKEWNDLTEDKHFSKSAMALNDLHHGVDKPPQPFATVEEKGHATEDDEENVTIKCHLLYDEDKIERRRNQDGTRTKLYPWIPAPLANPSRLKSDVAIRGINRVGCEILERSGDAESGYKYVVKPDAARMINVLVKNVPHHAIRYVDKPYQNAQHGEWAFRHTIQFPDALFPKAWRDIDEDHSANDEL